MPFCCLSLSQTDQPCTPAFSCEALARHLPEQTPFRAGDVITMADGAASTPRLPVPVDLCVSIRPTCPSLATWSTSARVRLIVTPSSRPLLPLTSATSHPLPHPWRRRTCPRSGHPGTTVTEVCCIHTRGVTGTPGCRRAS